MPKRIEKHTPAARPDTPAARPDTPAHKRGRQINPTLPKRLHDLIKAQAAERGISITSLATIWLYEYASREYPDRMGVDSAAGSMATRL